MKVLPPKFFNGTGSNTFILISTQTTKNGSRLLNTIGRCQEKNEGITPSPCVWNFRLGVIPSNKSKFFFQFVFIRLLFSAVRQFRRTKPIHPYVKTHYLPIHRHECKNPQGSNQGIHDRNSLLRSLRYQREKPLSSCFRWVQSRLSFHRWERCNVTNQKCKAEKDSRIPI
jgi:hypothetical protein